MSQSDEYLSHTKYTLQKTYSVLLRIQLQNKHDYLWHSSNEILRQIEFLLSEDILKLERSQLGNEMFNKKELENEVQS